MKPTTSSLPCLSVSHPLCSGSIYLHFNRHGQIPDNTIESWHSTTATCSNPQTITYFAQMNLMSQPTKEKGEGKEVLTGRRNEQQEDMQGGKLKLCNRCIMYTWAEMHNTVDIPCTAVCCTLLHNISSSRKRGLVSWVLCTYTQKWTCHTQAWEHKKPIQTIIVYKATKHTWKIYGSHCSVKQQVAGLFAV